MLPPPPRSTLFPYTTLFRSLAALAALRQFAKSLGIQITKRKALQMVPIIGALVGASFKDRKSTRLNSSHRTISYAVFCLKKKKKIKKKKNKINNKQQPSTME